jgi:hypothetical protein
MRFFFPVLLLMAGLPLAVFSWKLSERYNAWTTSVRERNRRFPPPPTAEMRALNTRIMSRIIRTVGVCFIVLAAFTLVLGLANH